ncbi:DUF3144 domain-containing protein [Salinisphaera sp.]|jgi:hypothetical protein|uniref:DUF3144 domain-containing protein n=1 Tax=Salinisphaera sp. TaxID=1914330 RepID=UPI000C352357|nr:DUF3144 domain-containing protein [Salinisphaera sp.]MBS63708.1 hypothetical protein [Salinisphaera sp.]|tara:strand:+ start:322 stop:618 length:297 start_codon:yes stop_codon:yes gene_type:complete
MSGKSLSPAFRSRADEVIDIANRQSQSVSAGQVSASLMYATARFNAFQVAATAETRDDMAEERDNAIEYFTAQYRKMFEDHFDECMANFDRYTGRDKS